MERTWVTIDGNEAVATIAHHVSDVIAIYPITPSTSMGELADAWSAIGKPNLWGTVPEVIEMQSEGGAAGAIHGALQTGALATTFTASQGLLLMIPNMYKIAGELTPVVFHVAARALAAQGLSIFGDQSDVMATRATGFALLGSGSVQEAQDLAAIAHAATLQSRVPFLHFFDGFRTSHEIAKIQQLADADLHALIGDDLVHAHRARALSPDHPVIRGTAQNPDTYFQGRETVNPYYEDCPRIVAETMDHFAAITGRRYHLFEYVGAPDADRVIIQIGSGAETSRATAQVLNDRGEKVGVLQVRLFRPFSVAHFIRALPPTVRAIAVLDRTKEPGSAGEPLYLDVVTALNEALSDGLAPFERMPRVIGGRYGLGSKEYTPAMAKAVFDELQRARPHQHFMVGITDDVLRNSLDYDPTFSIEDPATVRCLFYGLGSDGTVGANKNSIKIIGEETSNEAQGYFVYDSKKSGSITISHLRFGPQSIRAPYLIEQANFIACHQFSFLERMDVLQHAAPGAVFLLNSPYGPEEVWIHLPRTVQQTIIDRHLRFYVIDAQAVARETGMGGRINTIMQTCFFAVSGVLPREEAIAAIKKSVVKTYSKRGPAVVERNFTAIDQALNGMFEVNVSRAAQVYGASTLTMRPPVPVGAPAFVRDVLGPMIAGHGDDLPISAFPVDGTYPVGTARFEKRNIADEIPTWDASLCIQCGKCAFVCPHAAIRMKIYDADQLAGAPATFRTMDARFFKEYPGKKYTLQVAPEDCTGCTLCVDACPVKDKKAVADSPAAPVHKALNMAPQPPLREQEAANWAFFSTLPNVERADLSTLSTVKHTQLLEPLFEFSGACSGCGETPYLKLITQLYGDRAIVANATGCSSIYGGNLPTTPWAANAAGNGPAWANSLFEDNAEFGLGMRLTLDKQQTYARELVARLTSTIDADLARSILENPQTTEQEIAAQHQHVATLTEQLRRIVANDPDNAVLAADLLSVADTLVRRSVWIVGGDGWAYDIGFGGLDHVLAAGRNVNILVLDTEVYSNTGGQASKSTPRGAVAKFAARGKSGAKKDLGLLAMDYGNVYVARIAYGADDVQTLHAFQEAESYDGVSLIIAYSHCIAHGIDMAQGLQAQRHAVATGYWPLYHFDPRRTARGEHPLVLDSKDPTEPIEEFMYQEDRFKMLDQSDHPRAAMLLHEAQDDATHRWTHYRQLALLDD